MFPKHLPDLLWGEDKRVQVMEISALVVFVPAFVTLTSVGRAIHKCSHVRQIKKAYQLYTGGTVGSCL